MYLGGKRDQCLELLTAGARLRSHFQLYECRKSGGLLMELYTFLEQISIEILIKKIWRRRRGGYRNSSVTVKSTKKKMTTQRHSGEGRRKAKPKRLSAPPLRSQLSYRGHLGLCFGCKCPRKHDMDRKVFPFLVTSTVSFSNCSLSF